MSGPVCMQDTEADYDASSGQALPFDAWQTIECLHRLLLSSQSVVLLTVYRLLVIESITSDLS